MDQYSQEKRVRLILLFIILSTIILRLPSLYTVFLDIDEAQNGYFAWAVLNGRLPYQEIVGDKPFFNLMFFSIGFILSGISLNYYAVHLVLIVWVIGQVFYIYKIGSLGGNFYIGLISALFYSVFSTCFEPKIIAASAELIMNLPLIMGVYYFLRYWRDRDKNKTNYLLLITSGILCGIAFNTSLKGGIILLTFGLVFLIFFIIPEKQRLKALMKELIIGSIFLISFITPLLLNIVYFYYIGVLDDFLFWLFEYNFRYVSRGSETIPISKGIFRTSLWIVFTFVQWLFAYYSSRALFKRDFWYRLRSKGLSSTEKLILFSFIWFITSFIALSTGKRYYGHYFLQSFPALAVLASISAYQFLNRVWKSNHKGLIIKKKLFILGVIIPPIIFFVPKISQSLYFEMAFKVAGVESANYKAIGRYIKNNSKKSDTIYVWGFATQIYYYSEREVAGRFSWSDFKVGRIPGSRVNMDKGFDNSSYIICRAWPYFFEDMKKYRPIYFVDTSSAGIHEYAKFTVKQDYYRDCNKIDLSKYRLTQWLRDNYYLERVVEGVSLYRRKS